MGVNEYTLKYNRNLFSHTEMHINTVIMKAVSCPPWFQTVQRNNLEAQCTKTKVNTQRISASEELFLWWPTQIGANVLQWMNVKGSNKKEQNMHILFEVVPIIAQWWRLRNFDFSAKIFSIYLTFVSRCINTHTHTHLEVTVVNWCNANKTEQNWIKR